MAYQHEILYNELTATPSNSEASSASYDCFPKMFYPTTNLPKDDQDDQPMEFVGPADSRFKTFSEQVRYFLDHFCPDWNSDINPCSYILPPKFEFKLPDVNDQSFLSLLENSSPRIPRCSVKKHRTSDSAEFIVFRIISKFINEQKFAPFLAFYNFDIDRRLKSLKSIFPQIDDWKGMQFDFLIIGKNIGIILIEVKSSDFKRDFGGKSDKLPDRYNHGVIQLENIDRVIKWIRKISSEIDSSQWPPVKKILFAPNLNGNRYANWKLQLPREKSAKLESMIKDVVQIFAPNSEFKNTKGGIGSDSNQGRRRSSMFGEVVRNLNISTIRDGYYQPVPIERLDRFSVRRGSFDLRVEKFVGKRQKTNRSLEHLNMEFDRVKKIDRFPEKSISKGIDRPSSKKSLIDPPTAEEIDRSTFEYFANKFEEIFTECSEKITIDNFPPEQYENYSKYLAGMFSAICLDRNNYQPDEKLFSNQLALSNVDEKLDQQDFRDTSRNLCMDNFQHHPLKSTANFENRYLSSFPVYYLTPDQIDAYRCRKNRQILFGIAGTGKSLLIQSKAIELLANGQTVWIFCGWYYRMKYKELFDRFNFTNYQLRRWDRMTKETIGRLGKGFYDDSELKNYLINELNLRSHTDHIFFDDSQLVHSTEESWRIFRSIISILSRDEIGRKRKTVWIAIDLFGAKFDRRAMIFERYADLIENWKFTYAVLRQVMRSSENVFQNVHSTADLVFSNCRLNSRVQKYSDIFSSPICSHKVQGIEPNIFRFDNFDSKQKAREHFSNELSDHLRRFLDSDRQPIRENFVAVLLSGDIDRSDLEELKNFLDSYFRRGSSSSKISVEIMGCDYFRKEVCEPNLITNNNRFVQSGDRRRLPTIVIAQTLQVLSFEWPIVVHAIFCKNSMEKEDRQRLELLQYQARTRARTTFLEYLYSYGD